MSKQDELRALRNTLMMAYEAPVPVGEAEYEKHWQRIEALEEELAALKQAVTVKSMNMVFDREVVVRKRQEVYIDLYSDSYAVGTGDILGQWELLDAVGHILDSGKIYKDFAPED